MPEKSLIEVKLDDELAQHLLEKISEYYDEPVRRVSEYCDALYDWIAVCYQAKKEYDELSEEQRGWSSRPPLYEIVNKFNMTDVAKSNFLARRIYGGEPKREEKCPSHNGHWSGCDIVPCPDGCNYGDNITGWLRPRHEFVSHTTEIEPGFEKIVTDLGYNPRERCRACGGIKDAIIHKSKESLKSS